MESIARWVFHPRELVVRWGDVRGWHEGAGVGGWVDGRMDCWMDAFLLVSLSYVSGNPFTTNFKMVTFLRDTSEGDISLYLFLYHLKACLLIRYFNIYFAILTDLLFFWFVFYFGFNSVVFIYDFLFFLCFPHVSNLFPAFCHIAKAILAFISAMICIFTIYLWQQ